MTKVVSPLPKRRFGPRLETTVVGFGGGALSGESGGYGFGSISDRQSMDVLERAYELGIRLYDTAPIYGFGESERRLGDFFAAHPSFLKECVVVTKLGVDWDANRKVRVDNSPDKARFMLEASLKRLRMDRIDVYMIHWPDPSFAVERTMEALVRMQEEGLITSLAASNFDQDLIRRAESVGALDVIQSPFSVMESSAKETLLPVCGPQRGFMSYGLWPRVSWPAPSTRPAHSSPLMFVPGVIGRPGSSKRQLPSWRPILVWLARRD